MEGCGRASLRAQQAAKTPSAMFIFIASAACKLMNAPAALYRVALVRPMRRYLLMTRANTPLRAGRIARMRAALYRPAGQQPPAAGKQHGGGQAAAPPGDDGMLLMDDDMTAVLVGRMRDVM